MMRHVKTLRFGVGDIEVTIGDKALPRRENVWKVLVLDLRAGI